ncbi:MAG TPA: hypothetical protein VGV92_07395 [Gammaproteobacteria bacterium]|nr:hypothetical protein [Gammaproteobacteria bacterium]
MSIRKSTFSGYELTGEDAEAFLRQISDPTPNPFADAAVRRGRKLAEEYARTGRATIKVDNEGKVIRGE